MKAKLKDKENMVYVFQNYDLIGSNILFDGIIDLPGIVEEPEIEKFLDAIQNKDSLFTVWRGDDTIAVYEQHLYDKWDLETRMILASQANDNAYQGKSSSDDTVKQYDEENFEFEKELFYEGIKLTYDAIDITFSAGSGERMKKSTDRLFQKLPSWAKNVMLLTAFSKGLPMAAALLNNWIENFMDKQFQSQDPSLQYIAELLTAYAKKEAGEVVIDGK